MNTKLVNRRGRAAGLVALAIISIAVSTELHADTGMCGGGSFTLPFVDVPGANIFFCSIGEAFFSGLTNGIDSTHYSPSASVPRDQMAAFVTRTMDQSIKRSSRRSALDQFWTNQLGFELGEAVGANPRLIKSDGENLFVACESDNKITEWSANTGKKIADWFMATGAFGVLVANDAVWITGRTNPGHLYYVLPSVNAPGTSVNVASNNLGANPAGIAYDGRHIFTANTGLPGGVSIIDVNGFSVTTVTTGFSGCYGAVYDGANVWVTDHDQGKLKKIDSLGNILLSVSVGTGPLYPAFDGTNIWVPNSISQSVSVVRARGTFAGTVVATLTLPTSPPDPNPLDGCQQAAFDGERIMVTSYFANSVSLWKASDLTFIGTFSTDIIGGGSGPFGVCSDGLNFWITCFNINKMLRY